MSTRALEIARAVIEFPGERPEPVRVMPWHPDGRPKSYDEIRAEAATIRAREYAESAQERE